jgi:hypothetical protein
MRRSDDMNLLQLSFYAFGTYVGFWLFLPAGQFGINVFNASRPMLGHADYARMKTKALGTLGWFTVVLLAYAAVASATMDIGRLKIVGMMLLGTILGYAHFRLIPRHRWG